jgi:hypothetical protein
MDNRNHQSISEPCPGFPQLFHDGIRLNSTPVSAHDPF